MLEQVRDLREEGDELYELLKTLDASVWTKSTPFKSWTVQEVVEHLHFSDRLAVLSLESDQEFLTAAQAMGRAIMQEGLDLRAIARREIGALAPGELRRRWRDCFVEMCGLLDAADPKARLKWFGPDMGVRMFATARQMETWAHGQDVFDLLGRPRVYTDRLKNIAVIGVRTFGWTFANRGLPVPPDIPYVRLIAPSARSGVEPAERGQLGGRPGQREFCHVVAQGATSPDSTNPVGETAPAGWRDCARFAEARKNPPSPGKELGAGSDPGFRDPMDARGNTSNELPGSPRRR
jgi:uncharacterized protein (TIGR03084 family)